MIRLSGGLRSALMIGVQGIRARKLRTLLSMVSLFLGVLAVVVVQAGAETAKRALLANVELTMGKDGTVQMFMPPTADSVKIVVDLLRGRTDAVATFTTPAIIGEPGVLPLNPGGAPLDDSDASRRYEGPPKPAWVGEDPGAPYVVCGPRGCVTKTEGDTQPPGQAIELGLTAMTGDIRPFRAFRLDSGEWLDFSSAPSLAPRIVVNRAAAKGFARHLVPAEMRIEGAIANATPRIVGVVDDGRDQPMAYVRADELLNWLPEKKVSDAVTVLRSPEAAGVEQILRARLAGVGITGEQIQTETINSRERVADELAVTRWVFLGMAGLVLLIGVAGILNVGLATVGERVEELALRRAVGTSRSLLAAIVLAETLLTGLLTAGVAIGVAAIGLKLGGGFLAGHGPFPQHLDFPWQAGVAGVVAGLAAGVLGGLVPALRAARIPIATVMRA